jgi:hypothetical protein
MQTSGIAETHRQWVEDNDSFDDDDDKTSMAKSNGWDGITPLLAMLLRRIAGGQPQMGTNDGRVRVPDDDNGRGRQWAERWKASVDDW